MQGRAAIFFRRDGNGIIAYATAQENAVGDAWQNHRFVMDVPSDAQPLVLSADLLGKGKVWIDGTEVILVGSDVR